jgi:hypothetical protein
MKIALIALASLAVLAPAAQAKPSPHLTSAEVAAAVNQAAQQVAGADSYHCHRTALRADCLIVAKRDGEPGSDGLTPPGTCVAPVTVVLRKRHVLFGVDLANGPHMQGFCSR